ncbi:hypothetical protein AGABI1DRAFT_114497 [Agaricus bisporus var. burnettii JB137-S8]|uniref:Uncharacterized protein n=1 Tax=Agaricus bisporus var. burnettii (strain JB137-S8 / ATCC MYA-4627 / FGSC 10392) TaxID=597362 RepID=K5WEA2_AGABU|nr:hypothetical protein AGABI2DRAFT_148602 [Agaricus bisporus var. bisporus H97]XP_007330730.1 uncharacterized protein AGABI1DRAFT_114496 [Agaricus bisporus var. burnettii JB137-S8]XP_007330731.1 uncharacterized protein AGABI1DRAFT_114497 [Agaricus bisporus var. burnettii JB137-S8]XP_007335795.1 uncharacterized protein AGABI1DRAFT_116851 [Agaricus bisporus var. burnettii JB137-S8]EKM73566.1 hypothetical protein AGABI1DRAFT_116851 [Agaricus bisporus var. burnettii JB137-S8]EKM78969.1 hypothetic
MATKLLEAVGKWFLEPSSNEELEGLRILFSRLHYFLMELQEYAQTMRGTDIYARILRRTCAFC